MQKFIIVQVDYKYCDYLRKFDKRVPYNSGIKRTRPFIGILFNVGDIEYFTPLSSPKEKHKFMKNNIDFIKLDRGALGAINFNNMIPVKKGIYKEIELTKENKSKKEQQYYFLIESQLLWLNRNYNQITTKAKKLYQNYLNNTLPTKVYERCCDFLLLEKKCLEYKKAQEFVPM